MELSKLEQVDLSVLSPEKIRTKLLQNDWINDEEKIKKLILDLSSLFIAFDTETFKGKEFFGFQECIKLLLKPLVLLNYLHIDYKNTRDRAFICIAPNKELTEFVTREESKKRILFQGLLLHAHFDVAPYKEPLGESEVMFDQSQEMIYGRGTCDMKSQISLIILTLYNLYHRGHTNNFLVLLSSDEEQACRLQGELLKKASGLINLDLEPTSTSYGRVAKTIKSTHFTNYVFFTQKRFDEDTEKLIKNEIRKYLDKFEIKYRLSLDEFNFNISIDSTEDFTKLSRILSPTFNNKIKRILESFGIESYCNSVETFGMRSRIFNPHDRIIRKSVWNTFGQNQYTFRDQEGLTDFNIIDETYIELFANYATALSITRRITGANNVIIASIPDRDRHGRYEAANLNDLVGNYNFIIDLAENVEANKEDLFYSSIES